MAIQADFKTSNGLIFPNAYIHITQYSGQKDFAEFSALVHESQEDRINGETPIENLNIGFSYDTDSSLGIIQQGYEVLKQLESLTNIIDV